MTSEQSWFRGGGSRRVSGVTLDLGDAGRVRCAKGRKPEGRETPVREHKHVWLKQGFIARFRIPAEDVEEKSRDDFGGGEIGCQVRRGNSSGRRAVPVVAVHPPIFSGGELLLPAVGPDGLEQAEPQPKR